MRNPLIGITTNLYLDETHWLGYRRSGIGLEYVEAVSESGCEAILLPYQDPKAISSIMSRIDGLLVAGGIDMSPLSYGKDAKPGLDTFCSEKDNFELELVKYAAKKGIPVLGICRGCQVINVAFGGTLRQDLNLESDGIQHTQKAHRSEPSHIVTIEKDSLCSVIFGKDELEVNSFHHQAVETLGKGLKIGARARSGLVEALEYNDFILGLQWHPEAMYSRHSEMKAPFEWLAQKTEKSEA